MAESIRSAATTEVNATTPAEAEPTEGAEDTGWVGKTEEEVTAEFGKPQFIMQTTEGAVWHYPRWRVQFDSERCVLHVERDVTSASKRPTNVLAKAKANIKSARKTGNTTRISNGGAEVDLGRILSRGRVTIVDFYADWCGPCAKVAPYLDRMAKEFDVDLVKIDIVRWNTPVAKQMNINSIPSIWVFDKNGSRVGSPTHDLRQVERYVLKASAQ